MLNGLPVIQHEFKLQQDKDMTLFSKTLDKFSGILKIIGGIAITAMMVLTVFDVVGRFFKHPIFGSIASQLPRPYPIPIKWKGMWAWSFWCVCFPEKFRSASKSSPKP